MKLLRIFPFFSSFYNFVELNLHLFFSVNWPRYVQGHFDSLVRQALIDQRFDLEGLERKDDEFFIRASTLTAGPYSRKQEISDRAAKQAAHVFATNKKPINFRATLELSKFAGLAEM